MRVRCIIVTEFKDKQFNTMRYTLTTLMAVISLATFGQTLNDILDGVTEVNQELALNTPLLQTMAPQNGTPAEVVVWKLEGVNHNDPNCFWGDFPSMTPDEALPVMYAFYPAASDTVECLFFEEGAYLIICLDEDGERVGEDTMIMLNEHFVMNGLETGYYEQQNGLTDSIKPLRIGRDQSEFVCFN